MSKITYKKVQEWVRVWNKYHPEAVMTTTFSLGYAAIGFLGEHGGISVVAQGSTPREAWDMFSAWKYGYEYAKERMGNNEV